MSSNNNSGAGRQTENDNARAIFNAVSFYFFLLQFSVLKHIVSTHFIF